MYVPARLTRGDAAPLIVFQDAQWYLRADGVVRAPAVLDELIHRGEIPPSVAVFVEPAPDRNAEYDAFDDRYAHFLIEELLPAIEDDFRVEAEWCIAGGSSGGNCAFTAAWLRPDRFRRVYCSSGSFVQMPRGNPYPDLIRATPPKPLRIWLEVESRDLNHNRPEYNWFSSNLEVAAALAERGYDFRLAIGDGEHDGVNAGERFPDALRWLFRR